MGSKSVLMLELTGVNPSFVEVGRIVCGEELGPG